MRNWKLYLLVGLVILGLLSACNLPMGGSELSVEDRVATSMKQTENAQPEDQENGSAENQDVSPATATFTLTPDNTATATITLTPTQEKPMISVSVDTNCRKGPGKIYDWIGALMVGEQAEVVGRSMDGQYWVIKNPDQAGNCWLWGNYANVTGPTSGLPQYTQPPTPTPAFYWAGTWTSYLGTEGGPYDAYVISVTVDNKTFTGLIDLGGGDYVNMTGTIADDYLSVSGGWTGPMNTGTFAFFAYGANQFQGHYDSMQILAWCGSRGGGAAPSPCEKH